MATLTVTSGLDDGAGSLRAAVAAANANPDHDTILFSPAVSAVTLTSNQLTLSTDMSIAGPAGGSVTVARSSAPGTPQFRIFATALNTTVDLSQLTITGGSAPASDGSDGGGILALGGLTLTSSTVSGNRAGNAGGGIAALAAATITTSIISGNIAEASDGGGIAFSGANLYVRSSTVSDNQTDFDGGGIAVFGDQGNTGEVVVESSTLTGNFARNGGAIYSNADHVLTVTSSTLSGNSSRTAGGGITFDPDEAGRLTVSQSTLSNNAAGTDGGGIYVEQRDTIGTFFTVTSSTLSGNSAVRGGGIAGDGQNMTLTDTIVANSLGGDLVGIPDLSSHSEPLGTFGGSGNLIEDGSGGASLGKISGDPNLGPLADNGGPTLTHSLLPGSIAIDAGVQVFGVLEDQRGLPRPIGAFDIGAVEVGGTSVGLVVTSGGDVTDANDGLTTLREAVHTANSNADASAITFAPGISTVTLTQGTLGLSSIVTISGPAGGTVTVTRAATAPDFGIFSVEFTGTAQLANLTISKGRGAAGISNEGALRVTASTITDNINSQVGGGGGIDNEGVLVVADSTISGNTGFYGGGIASGETNPESAALKVVNSTISGNTASHLGGGIFGRSFGERLIVRSSTIAGNGAPEGGGIYAFLATNLMKLENTIVADSTSGGDLAALGENRFMGSGNLVEDGSGGNSLGRISGDPKLASLANNGGPTLTHALLPGSIALNAGNNALADELATDQRGLNRLVGTVDIGAVEMQPQSRVTSIQPDPLNPGQNALFVYGTAGHDVIAVDRYGTNRYRVVMLSLVPGSWPSLTSDTFQGPVSRVVVYGGDGNDGIVVDNDLRASAWLYGENGNDVLVGGGGDDLLLGGSGNDVLTARGGRDILIGGTGADDLFAGSGGDLLIAGSTAFDLDEAALLSVHREWNSSRDFNTRVKNLRGTGTGARENGNNFLKVSGVGATVFSDSANDDLFGGSGRDWYFANRSGGGVKDDVFGQSNDVIEELP